MLWVELAGIGWFWVLAGKVTGKVNEVVCRQYGISANDEGSG